MTEKQKEQLARLQELWATRQATKRQILRCMELESKQRAEQQSATQGAADV